jgi:hypothetical protein
MDSLERFMHEEFRLARRKNMALTIRTVLEILGLVFLGMASFNISFPQVNFGWLGVLLIALALIVG